MAFIIKDRVKEGTTSTGTGDISLGGAAATFDTFQSYMSNGDTTYYAIVHTTSGTDEWEVGLGTWNTGNTLTRTTVLAGSNGTSAVNFSSGTKDIFMTYPAAHAALAGDDVNFANITVTGTVDGRDVAADGTKLDTVETNADVTDTVNVAAAGALMKSGGTMTGNLILNADPTTALGAATKEYVDTIASAGIHYHDPVRVETPSALTASYNNGSSGVGATLTNSGTQAALVIDGVTMALNDRVLVYNQTDETHNGIYTVTNVGSASTNWVMTRATDADSYGASDPDSFGKGDAFFVKEGNTGAGELYVMTTAGEITFGTTAIHFSQVAETAVYNAGTGLTLTGTTFSIGQDVGTTANVTFNQVTAAIIGNVTGNLTGDVTGNADTATALETARTIQLSGDVTGSATFDGTANINITAAVQDDSHAHVISNVDGLQAALDAKADDTTTITAGDGLTGGGSIGVNRTLNVGAGSGISVTADAVAHADTSSQASVNNSGNTFIQDVTLDGFGHVTGLTSGSVSVGDATITIAAGGGLQTGGDFTTNQSTNETITLAHADTSSVSSSNNSGNTFIQDLTFDTYGHVTAVGTGTVSVGNATINVSAGGGLTGGGDFTTNQSSNETLTLSHADTSSQASVNNSNGTVIQDITLDTYGHITGLASFDLDGRYYTETEADSRFVNVTGDTMTGLLIAENGIRVGTGDHNTDGRASITFGEGSTTSDSMYIEYDGENLSGDANAIIIGSSQAGVGDVFSVTYGGAVKVGTNNVFHDGYHPNADKWTTARTLTLNGDVSGSVSWDGSANATLSVTVANDSHTHDGRYFTESEADGRFVRKGVGYTWTAVGGNALSFRSNDTIDTATGDQASLEVLQDTAGADAFMQFHVAGDYAKYFGLHGGINDFVVGGWSYGAGYQRIFHDGYHPNADKWTTARTLSLSGDASGSVSWDGSANATLSVTVANDSHTHDTRYTLKDEFDWRGTGALTSTTTSALKTELLGRDVFDSYVSAFKTTWSYAGNGDLTDAGRLTELAGTSWLTWTDNSADNTQGNITALVIAPNTGGSAGKMFVYNDQGSGYAPGWREIWTSSSDGSGSGLDADLWDGNQFSSYLNQAVLTSSSPTFSNAYLAGSLYHSGDTDTRLLFDTNTITLQTGGSSEITVNATGVRLGDTGNGYFQPVSGSYGSIQIDGGAHSGWEGYSIGGRAVFMHDNSTATGIYNDVDNQWLFYGIHGGETRMYHAGTWTFKTVSANTVQVGNSSQNSSYILMSDNDHGGRYIHCNSNYIGFLNSSNGWSARSADNGRWEMVSGADVSGGSLLVLNDTGIILRSTTNGVGAKITFSDHVSGSYGQNGTLTYYHGDGSVSSEPQTSNDGWIFSGSEANTVVRVQGDVDVDQDLNVNNDIYVGDQIIHVGDTNTYMQFHAADQWRVVTGGGERLEVNNTNTTVQNNLIVNGTATFNGTVTGISASANDDIFWENGQTVTSNYTITNGKNAMSAGPITVNSGVTVTVGDGEAWTVV